MIYRRFFHLLTPFILSAILFCGSRAGMAATFVVTNTADSGAGSLRQAIEAANSLPGPDLIAFNIPGAGAHIIAPASNLPAISDATTIDGSTQPGYAGTPLISLSGAAGATSTGLILNPGNCAVRGLGVNGFPNAGVAVYGSSNVITGCFVGTDETGTIPRPNGIGLRLEENSSNNTIGGSTGGARNVISGNGNFGILVLFSSSNTIQGNRIGTDLTGTIALGNGSNGVFLAESFDNNVGGTKPGEGNVISANFGAGIQLVGSPSSTNNIIQGNVIGLDLPGSVSLGNAGGGIQIQGAPATTVGGVDPGAGNVISGNRGNGILIQAINSLGNVIEGNIIGLDSGGSFAIPNGSNGVQIVDSTGNTIGGTEAGAANVISGNSLFGIDLGGSNNVVQGNLIGTDANGLVALPNGTRIPSGGGVRVSGMNQDIGGDSIAARNLISGNLGNGIVLESAIGCVVQANSVGLDSAGKPLGNSGSGIVLWFQSQSNTIGGSISGQGNICAANGANGLLLNGLGTDANVCIGNYIGSTPDGQPRRNALAGISIREGASFNAIGGPNPGEGNVISGNAGPGIAISNFGTSNNALRETTLAPTRAAIPSVTRARESKFLGPPRMIWSAEPILARPTALRSIKAGESSCAMWPPGSRFRATRFSAMADSPSTFSHRVNPPTRLRQTIRSMPIPGRIISKTLR